MDLVRLGRKSGSARHLVLLVIEQRRRLTNASTSVFGGWVGAYGHSCGCSARSSHEDWKSKVATQNSEQTDKVEAGKEHDFGIDGWGPV
jgi:hypothetical protein